MRKPESTISRRPLKKRNFSTLSKLSRRLGVPLRNREIANGIAHGPSHFTVDGGGADLGRGPARSASVGQGRIRLDRPATFHQHGSGSGGGRWVVVAGG